MRNLLETVAKGLFKNKEIKSPPKPENNCLIDALQNIFDDSDEPETFAKMREIAERHRRKDGLILTTAALLEMREEGLLKFEKFEVMPESNPSAASQRAKDLANEIIQKLEICHLILSIKHDPNSTSGHAIGLPGTPEGESISISLLEQIRQSAKELIINGGFIYPVYNVIED